MKIIKSAVIIFLLMMSFEGWSQSYKQVIRGTVVDAETKNPLPYASVSVRTTDPILGTTTEFDGAFRIEDVPVGRHDITISFIGYETRVIPEIMLTSGKEFVIEISLTENAVKVKEVEIKAYMKKDEPINSMATLSARTFSVEEAQRYAGGFDDPARLASSFAGVTSGYLDDNGIIVRGNAPKGLLWRLEGVEVPNPNHFAGMTTTGGGGVSALSSLMLANSDFSTGAFPAEYGNALSGVFDIKLRTGNNENYEHAFQLGVMGVDVSSEGPFSKNSRASYLFNYRYSTFGLIKPVLPEESNIPIYQDICFKVNMPTKKAGIFSVWGLAADDKIAFDAEQDTSLWSFEDDQYFGDAIQRMGVVGLNHRKIFSSKTYANTSLSLSGDYMDMKTDMLDFNMNEYASERIDNINYKYTLSTQLSHKFNAKHTNRSGLIINNYNYRTTMKYAPVIGLPLITFVDENGSSALAQVYTQSKISIGKKVTANVGIHGQYFQLNKEAIVEPRIGLTYKLGDLQSVSIAYGKHSRMDPLGLYFANIYENNMKTQPNKSLGFTKAHHIVVAYDRSLNEHIRLKVEPYVQFLYDVPVIIDSSYSTLNMEAEWYFANKLENKGTGTNFGIDLTLERFLNKGYYYLFTASVFESKYVGGDNIERMTRFNTNYVVNLLFGKEWVVGKAQNKIFGINGRLNVMGGQRMVPVNKEQTIQSGEMVYDYNRTFESQKPMSYYLNASVTYRINKKKRSSIWTLQVLNALGDKQFYGYDFNYRTKTIDRNEVVVVVPNISYKIEF